MYDAPSSTHAYDASVERCLLYLGNYQSLGLINLSVPHFFIMENLDHNIHIGRLIDEVLKSKGMTHMPSLPGYCIVTALPFTTLCAARASIPTDYCVYSVSSDMTFCSITMMGVVIQNI